MNKILACLVLLGFSPLFLTAQSPPPVVSFLDRAPVIDGKPEPSSLLPQQLFAAHTKSSESNPAINASYALGYGADFLYVAVLFESDRLVIRENAFRFGDGLILMLGAVANDTLPCEDFHVLGFSASGEKDGKVRWYLGKELQMKPLGDEVQVAHGRFFKFNVFEVLIPWKALYPFNPFLAVYPPVMNLCLVNAVGDKDVSTSWMIEDEHMQSENAPRKYVRPLFREVPALEKPAFYCLLQQSVISSRDPVSIGIRSLYRKADTLMVKMTVFSGENTVVYTDSDTLLTGSDPNTFYLSSRSNFSSGGYRLEVRITAGDSLVKADDSFFTVLPDVFPNELAQRLVKLKSQLNPGTYNTLMLLAQEYEGQLMKLKPYQTAFHIRQLTDRISYIMGKLYDGEDLLSRQKGLVRRGYYDEADSIFRPYTLFVPKWYQRGRIYPLIVYLHDSGEDDNAIAQFLGLVGGDYMVLAPNGRDKTNLFATPEALEDVRLALQDVVSLYTVDTANIVLAGYSSGGYGVYRVFREFPSRFRSLAVMSGHPALAGKWLKGTYPDFTQTSLLGAFKGREMFLFHGTEDRVIPYDHIPAQLERLKKAGVKVEFRSEPTGHNPMGPESRAAFLGWLKRVAPLPF